MSDLSSRRRVAGRGLLVAAALAVPMTASISYAEEIAAVVPAAPAAPSAPAVNATPPAAPLAPEAPLAPQAPLALSVQSGADADADAEAKIEKKVRIERSEEVTDDGKRKVKIVRTIGTKKNGEPMSDEEIEEFMAGVHEDLAEADHAVEEAHIAMLNIRQEYGEGQHIVVRMKCEGDEATSSKVREDGTNVVMICQSKIVADALASLTEAREQIAASREMPDDSRKEAFRNWIDDKPATEKSSTAKPK